MQDFLSFIQANKPYAEAATFISSVVNIVGWSVGSIFLIRAWRRNGIDRVTVGPLSFKMQEAAVEATASAARNWQASTPTQKVDVPRIRATISRAFAPEVADNLIGKSILWVDDNPANNELAVRALRKLQLDVEQATSTPAGLEVMQRRHFDLIISDMGRGADMRAGYELLAAIRATGNQVPFLIFAGSDRKEFRHEAAARGAQLSTNDMIELVDAVIQHLSNGPV
jgi:CheY-like chemotaxis protein